jgi:hypothetical protein
MVDSVRLLRNRAVFTRSLGQGHKGHSDPESGPELSVLCITCRNDEQQSVSVSGQAIAVYRELCRPCTAYHRFTSAIAIPPTNDRTPC